MPSFANQVPQRTLRRRGPATFEVWNRRLHFYIGLYLLFFLWLFGFTGPLRIPGQGEQHSGVKPNRIPG